MAIIVADLGINHNGSFDTLIELADMAMGAGVDYVKLQLRTPRICVPEEYWNVPKQWFDGTQMTYIEYREAIEFSDHQLQEFGEYVDMVWGGKWFASVWDIPSVTRFLEIEENPDYIKIPSAMITNIELLKHVDTMGIPVIMSMGMSTPEEILDARAAFARESEVHLLHCNSSYPTADNEVDLAMIPKMIQHYGAVGFSSHSSGPVVVEYAMVLGADIVEVHVTLDRTMQGSDHAASLEKSGLERLVRQARRIPILMGRNYPRLYDSELLARRKLRGE